MPAPKPSPTAIHNLLARQLRRHRGIASPEAAPEEWQAFLDAVNDAYLQGDGDRSMLERSLDLSSQELLQTNRSLRRSEQDYRGLFELAHDAIVIFDPETECVLEANQSACQIYGYRRDELVNLELGALADMSTARPRLRRILETGQLPPFETVHRRKDGTPMYLEVHASLVDYRDRKAVLSIHRDITDRVRAEREREELIQELEARNAEIEERNAEMERFTYTISHDLKSPIFTIQGFLGLLAEDVAEGNRDAVESDIRQIRSAASHVRRLLDELLELSRVGRVINEPEEVALADLARRATDICAGQIHERGVDVVIHDDLPTVVADRPRFLEVFQNLIENAVKFMGEESAPRIEISARPDADGGPAVVRVADNGIGIDPVYHDRVFGLFDRLNIDDDGTGIGLALVKRVIEVHGGRIWIESEGAGRGTTFCFTVPSEGPREG